MRLGVVETEGAETVKRDREAKWWRSWLWLIAAEREDPRQAALYIVLSAPIFSIFSSFLISSSSVICSENFCWEENLKGKMWKALKLRALFWVSNGLGPNIFGIQSWPLIRSNYFTIRRRRRDLNYHLGGNYQLVPLIYSNYCSIKIIK